MQKRNTATQQCYTGGCGAQALTALERSSCVNLRNLQVEPSDSAGAQGPHFVNILTVCKRAQGCVVSAKLAQRVGGWHAKLCLHYKGKKEA